MKAIILGSGMGDFCNYFEIQNAIPFTEFMNIDNPMLEGHARRIHIAKHREKTFVIISGKLHFYEGFIFKELVEPLKYVIEEFDVDNFVVTSASGGLNPDLFIGQWIEIGNIICVPRIPKLEEYGKSLASRTSNLSHSFTYAFHSGPNLGTKAEYKFLHTIGADLVGMSMYPEKLFLDSKKIQTEYFSLPVCNYYPFNSATEPSHKEVIEIASQSIPQLVELFVQKLLEE